MFKKNKYIGHLVKIKHVPLIYPSILRQKFGIIIKGDAETLLIFINNQFYWFLWYEINLL